MEQTIRVGFEYEGVIKNSNNTVVRFKDLTPSSRKNIITNYEKSPFYNSNPYDNYDCLAEIKTIPIPILKEVSYKEQARNILYTLFGRIEYMSTLFKNNGYGIDWCECDITDETHNIILRDWEENKDISVIQDGLSQKTVYTLDKEDNKIQWKSKDNRRRGGGLHITISGLGNILTPKMINDIHNNMIPYRDKNMSSAYRKNLIFRLKEKDGIKLFEYMSFGFQLQKRYNFFTMFHEVKHQFHWIEMLIRTIQSFDNRNIWEEI